MLLAEHRVAQVVEEPALLLRRPALRGFELFDARIGQPQRLVLDKRGLNQGIERVRRVRYSVTDCALGVRIARLVFERREAIE